MAKTIERKIVTKSGLGLPPAPLVVPAPVIASDSPHVNSLMVVSHVNGVTDITARVLLAGGWQNKRTTLPGVVTAHQIASMIENVENW